MSTPDSAFRVEHPQRTTRRSQIDLLLSFRAAGDISPQARLWLFYEPRQGAGGPQTDDATAANYLSLNRPKDRSARVTAIPRISRTLDLYPAVPEFHYLAEVELGDAGLAAGETLGIQLASWDTPQHAIDPFRFWLLVDGNAVWELSEIGYRQYRAFVDRKSGERIGYEELSGHLHVTRLAVEGANDPIPASSRCPTPGVFWGEIHGMVFNQRPLDDFYRYGREVTQLDFCAPSLFSYLVCVGDEWERFKEAARRHYEPGAFVSFLCCEYGTPPDDSHRVVAFPDPAAVPPIFCDSRPPAQEALLQRRFHPDTVFCSTLEEFYAAVENYGGFVYGHHHTTTYAREILAELWQKQKPLVDEEERIFAYLRKGMRLGLNGGSDTHDSMPGNPHPEPGCPRAAGFTGVWADELTREALTEAFRARRVFATTGTRLCLAFDSEGHPMGSQRPDDAPRAFHIQVDGTAELESVELLRGGFPCRTWNPGASVFETEVELVPEPSPFQEFYLVRVRQTDGHQGWSSPIWFG